MPRNTMPKTAMAVLGWLVLAAASFIAPGAAHAAEVRFALVIGNDEYKTAKLATPANDAGLIADTLQQAGFDVTGARNLDQDTLRRAFREFLDKVGKAGPDAVAFVYLAGFGMQFEGENYFVPVDADIQRDVDVPIQAIRVSDFTRPLAALPGRVKIVVLDAARENPYVRGGEPLAGGLALVDPEHTMAIAFNAAPGTIGPTESGPYGVFATSLVEMMHAGGLSLDDMFARLRLRVSELTNGAEVPWYASQIEVPFLLAERADGAPPPPAAMPLAEMRTKPMRSYSRVEEAYAAALGRDTLDGYEDFLAVYPQSPFAYRVGAMLAARREALIWRRCVTIDTPPAYWSYLRRYPDGPHAFDARRQLSRHSAGFEPPRGFAPIEFNVPPPPQAEIVYVNRPVMVFSGGKFAPPPPPPVVFLPPRPREYTVLPPPPPPRAAFFLPTPAAVAGPAHIKPPTAVVMPAAPAAPNARGPIALPGAVQAKAVPGAPTAPGATAPAQVPPGAASPGRPGGSPLPPPAAAVKPAPPTPPAANAPKPAALPPPNPAPLATPPAAAVAPATPPPPLRGPANAAKPPNALPPPAGAAKPGTPLAPPSSAAVKPATPPPPPNGAKPAALPPPAAVAKPVPPPAAVVKPPPPPAAIVKPPPAAAIKPPPPPAAVKPPPPPAPVAVKPPPPPPAAVRPPPPPAPVAVKPPPPPPAAVRPPPPPAPAAVKPPPPPAPPKPAAKPCPPGKTNAVVNGQQICR